MNKNLLLNIIKIKCLKHIYIICIYFCNFTDISLAQPEKKKVLGMLEGRHWVLNTNEFLKLEEGTDDILIDIAGDTTLINYLRFRALEALALYPTEKTADFLEMTIENKISSFARRGFETFRRGFKKIKPKRVKKLAIRLLKHQNANIRISAARTLHSMDPSEFKKFIKLESSVWVRKEAQKQINSTQQK